MIEEKHYIGDFRRKDGEPIPPLTMNEMMALDMREMEIWDGERWLDGATDPRFNIQADEKSG